MTAQRIRACAARDLPPGAMLRIEPDDRPPVAVYNIEGTFFATDDRCTHSVASLSSGELEGDCVVCPVHFGVFHVPTGEARCFPVKRDLATHPVEVDGQSVFIVVRDPADARDPQEAA